MLYICPTPIGNLKDITQRTLETLQEVDEIYCEDTRITIKLLNHYEIKKPLYTLEKHREQEKSKEIIEKLQEGKKIAYVSDAGMPGISDPGQILIQRAKENNQPYTVLPGASAMITALVASGLCQNDFYFAGFLPDKKAQKKEKLQELKQIKSPIIYYIAPHDLMETLEIIQEIIPENEAFLTRELTKKYEEYTKGTIKEIISYYKENKDKAKGEIALIVINKQEETKNQISNEEIKDQLNYLIENGMKRKPACQYLAKLYNISKNQLYNDSL